MKKICIYIIVAIAVLSMQSCLHDNNDNFDLSAAERIDALVNESYEVLESAENGWVLHYYTGIDYAYGGLNFTVKFKDGRVSICQQGATDNNDEYITSTSTYRINRDRSAVLAFDTYNDFLHIWAEPDASKNNAPTDVDGWQADYEFVIFNISEDKNTILLKGKKWGNYMIMERLQKTPAEYLDDAAAIANKMSEGIGLMKYDDGEFTAKFLYSDGQYIITYTDADGNKQTLNVPFTYTDDGVIFCEPIELNGNVISGVVYAEDSETFSLKDTKGMTISISYDPVDVFQSGNWYLYMENLGEVAAAGLQSFIDTDKEVEGEDLDFAYIGTSKDGDYGFCFRSGGRYNGCTLFDVETEGADVITFSYAGDAGNGEWYRENDNLGDATDPFFNTFKLTTDDVYNPTYFILTDVNNEKNVIKLVQEKTESNDEN